MQPSDIAQQTLACGAATGADPEPIMASLDAVPHGGRPLWTG